MTTFKDISSKKCLNTQKLSAKEQLSSESSIHPAQIISICSYN